MRWKMRCFAMLWAFTCLIAPSLMITASHAQMNVLSEIQDSVFHLSHRPFGFNAETFYNDSYIDEWQADFFAAAASTAPFTPADDNYPFYLIDDYVLGTDLVIEYKYQSGAGQPPRAQGSFNAFGFYQSPDDQSDLLFPDKRYLSRHNISLSKYKPTKHHIYYSDQRGDSPLFFKGPVNCPDFGDGNPVTGYEVRNYEIDDFEVGSNRVFEDFTKDDDHFYFGWEAIIDVYVARAAYYIWIRTEDTELINCCKSGSSEPINKTSVSNVSTKTYQDIPNPLYRPETIEDIPCRNCR